MSIMRISFSLLLCLAAFSATSCVSDKQELSGAWKSPLCHPTIDERPAWDKLAKSDAGKNYLKSVEAYIAEPSENFDVDALYLDFRKSGNRNPYFKPYFRRDRRLCFLTFAECLENKGRFIAPLEKVIKEICGEKTWVLPCHDLNLDNFNGKRIDVTLYSSQRGAELALCDAMMGNRLSPDVRKLIREKVRERVTGPFRDMISGKTSPAWWLNFKNNWNSVCLANILAAGVYSASSQEEQDFFVENACKYIKYYLAGFPPDGYCTEGTGYWEYGFGHYIYFSEIVRIVTGGKTNPMLWPEALKPAVFPFRAEIVNGVYPVFADCPMMPKPNERLLGFVSKCFGLGYHKYESSVPVPRFDKGAYMLSNLNYVFCFFRDLPSPTDKKINIDNGIRTWFDDAQILICRGSEGVKSGFGAAFKGGFNWGPHHHLDLGTYTIVSGDMPIISDPGMEVYTKRSCGKDRYESRVLNSYGHPVPLVNGRGQKNSEKARAVILASDFTSDMDTLSLDIKAAYDDPTLKKLVRTFRFDRKNSAVEIEDSFEFDSPGTFENALITFGTFKKLPDGRLKISYKDRSVILEISSDCGHVSVSSETIEEDLPTKQKPLRIALKLDVPVSKGTLKVRIQKQDRI